MQENDIYTVYVGYVGDQGGKRRPVWLSSVNQSTISVFRITTKYQSKSVNIKKRLILLHDWQIFYWVSFLLKKCGITKNMKKNKYITDVKF